ncbi:hypothetical protein [Kitasatospora purpeofusca]|uniref:hypothetical protein n=1 Tax=Kitasatospora purpeofusca TaxID=67352 RepID=UPI000A7E9F69|nr:hypothetical protein [Kitasatospora purpeofusca]
MELAARAPGGAVCLDVNHRAELRSREEAAAAGRLLVPRLDIVVACRSARS